MMKDELFDYQTEVYNEVMSEPESIYHASIITTKEASTKY